jgi:ABC-type lipoprotein export system ATPase subunit
MMEEKVSSGQVARREGARPVLEAHEIKRDFGSGLSVVHALRSISLQIMPGEFVVLRGRSGSGKTTLLNILVGLDDPTGGEVILLGHALRQLDEPARARLCREQVGMIFQNAHLFPSLTAQENVEIPLRLVHMPAGERSRRSLEALRRVGLEGRIHHRGLELSGGEQQRVALARALVHEPRFIVADEPTGNLDTTTARQMMQLLRELAHERAIGLLMATHDPEALNVADRVLEISDGLLIAEREVNHGPSQ